MRLTFWAVEQVEKCSLGDDGAKILAKQALNVPAKCRNLQGLYLCENGIGPAGAKSLATALQHLRQLRECHTSKLQLPVHARPLSERLLVLV